MITHKHQTTHRENARKFTATTYKTKGTHLGSHVFAVECKLSPGSELWEM